MTSRKRNFMIIVLTLALVATGLSASYAWLVSHGDSQDVDGYMGTVAVGISDKTEVDTDGKLDFTITNGSNIDTYMRLGWTPIYRKDGEDTTTDTSGVGVNIVTVNLWRANSTSLGTASTLIPPILPSWNNYEKKKTILLTGTEDSKYVYFRIPQECETITGTITVTGYTQSDHPDETLHLILVPEAIQATEAAVTAARAYGWDATNMVTDNNQDRTVILEQGGGGNP